MNVGDPDFCVDRRGGVSGSRHLVDEGRDHRSLEIICNTKGRSSSFVVDVAEKNASEAIEFLGGARMRLESAGVQN